jgi:hypothetical protein
MGIAGLYAIEENIFVLAAQIGMMPGMPAWQRLGRRQGFQRLSRPRPACFAPVDLDCGIAAYAGVTTMPDSTRRGVDLACLAAASAFILYGKEPSNER